jgi:hypothetical protein
MDRSPALRTQGYSTPKARAVGRRWTGQRTAAETMALVFLW